MDKMKRTTIICVSLVVILFVSLLAIGFIYKSKSKKYKDLENKLVEIFLSCGKVVLCGLEGMYEKKLGKQDKLFYVREGSEAFKYLSV